jgi:hypothetical protein
MSLYLVRKGDRQLWVGYEREDGFYTYLANTGQFVRNDAVGADFLMDREMDYEPLTPDQAQAKMAAGVGRVDERKMGWLVKEFRAEEAESLTVEQVFGAQPQQLAHLPNRRARAQALAHAVSQAQPDQWITWRTYPPDNRQAAQAAAHDLRTGKVRALADLAVDTRVVPTADETCIVVQVTRADTSASGNAAVSTS